MQVIILDEADSMTQAAQQAGLSVGADPQCRKFRARDPFLLNQLLLKNGSRLVEAMRRTMEIFSWNPRARERVLYQL